MGRSKTILKIIYMVVLLAILFAGCGSESVSEAQITPTFTPTPTSTPTPTNTPTPTEAPKDGYVGIDTLESVLYSMLVNGETDWVDVSRFKLSKDNISTAWAGVVKGDGAVAYAAVFENVTIKTSGGKKNIQSICLNGIDDKFLERYALSLKTVDEALACVDPAMSDLEKALILHEYIVDKASYNLNTDGSYKGWGILAYSEGGCMSYTAAYNLLLKLVGIEAREYRSGDMGHRWSIVKLDGKWYQVDATWDDTRLARTGKHYYFLRTDNEFQNQLASAHYNYGPAFSNEMAVVCDSTRFTDWFVHDVKGNIVYCNGYWYWGDGQNLKKARIDGTDMQIVVTESANVTVVKSESGYVIYKVGNEEKKVK